MVCGFGFGGGGGGGGCAARRSVTSTDVQARACFMCAATPLTCACYVYPASTPSPRRSHGRLAATARHRRDARKRTPFPHARRERALFNFVRVLDGRLGHADGLWVSGGGRRGEVDARGFVGGRRVGACERRVASMLYLSRLPRSGISLLHRGTASLYPSGTPSRHHLSIPHRNAIAAPTLYTPPERRRCDARKGRRVTHASLVGSLWRAPRLLFLASALRLEAFRRRPRPGAGWG